MFLSEIGSDPKIHNEQSRGMMPPATSSFPLVCSHVCRLIVMEDTIGCVLIDFFVRYIEWTHV